MGQLLRRTAPPRRRVIGGVIVLVLLGAMVLDTTFLDPDGVSEVRAPTFSPTAFVEEAFPQIAAAIAQDATDITELAPAVEADPAAAGEAYGIALGAGRFVHRVTATGSVTNVDADFIELAVPGLPDADVRVPLGTALSGTPIRDATGTIAFGDFPDQTAYQSVANEFKLRVEAEVLGAIDPPSLQGKQITVTGAYVSGGPPIYIIQPVAIEVAP